MTAQRERLPNSRVHARFDFEANGNFGLLDGHRVARATLDVAECERWHRGLSQIAERRGYQPGWIARRYKQKFSTWRKRHKVTASAHSRAIAYRKAKARAAS
jgi:hypothetical protein